MGLTILVYEFPFVRKQIKQISLYSSIKNFLIFPLWVWLKVSI